MSTPQERRRQFDRDAIQTRTGDTGSYAEEERTAREEAARLISEWPPVVALRRAQLARRTRSYIEGDLAPTAVAATGRAIHPAPLWVGADPMQVLAEAMTAALDVDEQARQNMLAFRAEREAFTQTEAPRP